MVASLVVGLFGKLISEKTSHRLTIFAVFLSFVFSGIVLADSLSGAIYNYTVYKWAVIGTLNFEIGFFMMRPPSHFINDPEMIRNCLNNSVCGGGPFVCALLI